MPIYNRVPPAPPMDPETIVLEALRERAKTQEEQVKMTGEDLLGFIKKQQKSKLFEETDIAVETLTEEDIETVQQKQGNQTEFNWNDALCMERFLLRIQDQIILFEFDAPDGGCQSSVKKFESLESQCESLQKEDVTELRKNLWV